LFPRSGYNPSVNSRPVRVVLVRPRNPVNIGACARAMGNFGLTDLVVVEPYEPVWQETRSAPDAEEIVKKARAVATWEEAVKNCDLVLGTSSFHQRPLEQATVELPNVNLYLAAFPTAQSLALVFGSERSGLSNEELVRCRAILHIPTNKNIPSMNLGQAVAVVLYELRRAGWEPAKAAGPAPAEELESLIGSLAALGEATDYPHGYEPPARLGRIRRALQDSTLTPAAVRYLLSFTRWLLKRQSSNAGE
jgi:TrmH family RNA methyltransferase